MMREKINFLQPYIVSITKNINSVGVFFLAVMMLVTAVDVFLRYVFNRPVMGSVELTGMALLMSVLWAIPFAGAMKRHIAIDIVSSRLNDRNKVVLESVAHLINLFLVTILVWRVLVYMGLMSNSNMTTSVLHIPISPFVFLVAIAFAMYWLVLLYQLVQNMFAVIRTSGQFWRWIIIGAALLVVMYIFAAHAHDLPWRMNSLLVGLFGMIFLFIAFVVGVPVFTSLMLAGFIGLSYLRGVNAGLGVMGSTPFSVGTNFDLSVIPLFVLMGEFCFYSGIGKDLYNMAHKWLGHLAGGLAIATVGACGGFAAVCGDSMATALTMGTVALPEMKRYNYDDSLAAGTVASGGTLGVLIPPSLAFLLYALLADQSIATLFISGILPGILLISLFMGTIYIRVKRNPALGPAGPKFSFRERMIALRGVWATLLLFAFVIGGMYAGIFTPTEGGGIGAFGAMVIGLVRRRLSFNGIVSALGEAAKISAVCMTILIGANIFGYFLAASKLPMELAATVSQMPVPPIIILLCILVIYLFLGCLMPAIPMLILTVPIFYPVIVTLGYDPIWYGVIMVLMFEMAVITPPMGINVLALQSVAQDIPMEVMFKGVIWFMMDMVICVALLIIFPQIPLILPALLD